MLQRQRRGPRSEDLGKLSDARQEELKMTILEDFPRDHGLPFLLWNREAVQQLVRPPSGPSLVTARGLTAHVICRAPRPLHLVGLRAV